MACVIRSRPMVSRATCAPAWACRTPRNRCNGPNRHCEERSDEAIQFLTRRNNGLLRFVRNDRKTLSLPQGIESVSYTHLRAHETDSYIVCRLLLEKKKKT